MLGIFCVVLLGVAFSAAKTGQKASHKRNTTVSSHSTGSHSSAHAVQHTAKTGSKKSLHRGKTEVRKAGRTSKTKQTVKRPRGQQAIDGDRAREIQAALIREKYLDGEPSGVWDAPTKEAMVRFQNANGWQTKVVPDSRALIKLGLGPSHANLINADATSASMPDSARDLRPGGSVPQR